jgi:oligopeptide/dipeptide ABC transporter ATP-binding protein
MESLLQVRNLVVEHHSVDRGRAYALRGVNFDLKPGEVCGLLGESGSGKSTLGLTMLGLLPPAARITDGSIQFRGEELLHLSDQALQKIRGAEISMIWQEPELALNPVMPIGTQIAEVLRAHRTLSSGDRRKEVEKLLAEAGLSDTAHFYAAYPHELSGGQRQRAVIAQALACRPSLVIADEPTASLDTSTQARILSLLKKLKEQLQIALLIITHHPATLIGLADRVMVLYAGRIIEEGSLSAILEGPLHPYTKGLVASILRGSPLGANPRGMRLPIIAGNPPDPSKRSPGCSFAPRCPQRMEVCGEREPQMIQADPSRRVECFVYGG